MKTSKLWMMALLAILAVVCSAALAFVNIRIDPVIKQNERVQYKRIILNLFEVAYDPLNLSAIEETYSNRIGESETNGIPTFTEKQSGRKAVRLDGSGFQGPIQVMVALDGGTVTAFRVVSQVETPGLGSRITGEDFQKSFVGKQVDQGIKLVKGGSAGPNEFDAITGATETSRALERILNAGLSKYFNLNTGSIIPKDLDARYMASLLNVLGISGDAQDSVGVRKIFSRRIEKAEENGQTLYREKKSGAAALLLWGDGFRGPITLAVALRGDVISGFEVISHNESPGIGSRIHEEKFERQLVGKMVSRGITPVKTGKAGPNEFDAISGATVSSEAIARILNIGFTAYYNIKTEPAAPQNQEVAGVPVAAKHQKVASIAPDILVSKANSDAADTLAIVKANPRTAVTTDETAPNLTTEKENGDTALYLTGKGFADTIKVWIALKKDTISEFKVISQHETPGFGTRIQEESFQKQFIGKKVVKGIRLAQSGRSGPNEFDAIAGATETSRALERILNAGLARYFGTAQK